MSGVCTRCAAGEAASTGASAQGTASGKPGRCTAWCAKGCALNEEACKENATREEWRSNHVALTPCPVTTAALAGGAANYVMPTQLELCLLRPWYSQGIPGKQGGRR